MRACLCVCVCESLCVFVCVALHNFHANAASDDLPQSSFASCTPLPASLSSSLSPSLSCLFLFFALFTSTRSLSLFLSPLLVLFLLSRTSIAFLFLLAFLAAQNFVIFVFVERLLKRNVCCASSLPLSPPPPLLLSLPLLGDVFG